MARFTNLKWGMAVNSIPWFTADVFITNSTHQDLLAPGTPFRITTLASTNGFVNRLHDETDVSGTEAGSGFEIMTGFLGVPDGNVKTTVRNDKPVYYPILGYGLMKNLEVFEYNADNLITGTAAQINNTGGGNSLVPVINRIRGTVSVTNSSVTVNGTNTFFNTDLVVGSIVQFGNDTATYTVDTITSNTILSLTANYAGTTNTSTSCSRQNWNVVYGASDTGPSGLSIRVKHDNFLGVLLDVASLGDGTDNYVYYIDCVPNNVATGTTAERFKPRVHYRSSTNAIFETTNPLGGVDNGRTIDARTEIIDGVIIKERDRIINSVDVRFAGGGTGTSQSNTGISEDNTSVTNYGRNAAIVYAPWAQNSATAIFLRDTVLDMFKGSGTDGILRAEVVLKNGGMFSTDFDAILGDTVSVRRNSNDATGLITGKFLECSYDQNTSFLNVVIGIPYNPTINDIAKNHRQVRRLSNSLRSSVAVADQFIPASDVGFNVLDGSRTQLADFGGGTPSTLVDDDDAGYSINLTADQITAMQDSEGYMIDIAVFLPEPALGAGSPSDISHDGPLVVQVYTSENSNAGILPPWGIVYNKIAHHVFTNLRNGQVTTYSASSSTQTTPNFARISNIFGWGSGANPTALNSISVHVHNMSGQTITFNTTNAAAQRGIRIDIYAKNKHAHEI